MKRVLSVQDLTCVGKCSMMAAVPVISAMGAECCVLPTAVLSTHTAFTHVHVTHLTGDIVPVTEAWQQEGLDFSVISVGYLGSIEEIRLIRDLIHTFRTPETVVIIDPVMGDHGKLYRGFTDAYVEEMRTLLTCADILLPNATEAALLLGIPYEETTGLDRAKTLLTALRDLGVKMPVLTGVEEGESLGAALLTEGGLVTAMNQRLPGQYFGTGDLFTAVMAGAAAHGIAPEAGMKLAVDFVADSIRHTLADETRRSYGTSFEPALAELICRTESARSEQQ